MNMTDELIRLRELLADQGRRLSAQASIIAEYRRLGAMVEGPPLLRVQLEAASKCYAGSTGSANQPNVETTPDQQCQTKAS